MQRAATTGSFRILAHSQVEVFAGFLPGEGASENCGVAFGGHAAVVVTSDVAGQAVWQQPLFPVLQAHARIVRPVKRT